MLSDSGRQTDASAAWLQLEAIRPNDPRIQAALGRIALLRNQTAEARKRYQRAMALGIRDARLCTDFGILAHDAGFPDNEVQAAFERALKLNPSMDDARYQLAMLHMNAGRYAAALPYFQALHDVPKSRAFAYYTALANTQVELGMRKEAEASASQAAQYAAKDEEREFAHELVWMAKSELVVQLSPTGPARFRRIPLREGREPEPVNPFIAPGDRIERREGTLEAVDCSAPELRLTVSTGQDHVVLSLPDLGRVQVRKAGSTVFEFTCGTEEHRNVLVEYAVQPNAATGVAGLLRGIELR
jgi:hypothetical protein